MDKYKEIIFDASNNKIIERPYTEAEIIEHKKIEAEAIELAKKLTVKENARKSALNKLIDLGLTEEEIAAL